MQHVCLLETKGYSISLDFLESRISGNEVLIRTTLALNPLLGNLVFDSRPTWILTDDVERLLTYLEQHIMYLGQDSNHVSDAFVDIDLHFLIQAFEGEIRAENSGEFSLQFMLNVGQTGDRHGNTYLGCNSVVAVQNVSGFVDSCRAVLGKYEKPHKTQ